MIDKIEIVIVKDGVRHILRPEIANYKLFASNVQEYNRVCAEELCELLNQEQ